MGSPRRPAPDDTEREQLVRVAWLYYRDNLTQAEIAQRLHVSRPTVTRLLERARQAGVVSIEIDTRGAGGLELAAGLRERYGLADVVIVPVEGDRTALSGGETNARLARAGAQVVRRYLTPGAVIGIGWGDTVFRTLLAIPRPQLTGVKFATLTGGIDAYTSRVGEGENHGLSDLIRFVPSPLLASTQEIARALREERSVTAVLDQARSADATLVGIGAAEPSATILQNGVVSAEQLADYQAKGAVGDILGEWYDKRGRLLAVDLQKVRVGIAIRELRAMNNVIGLAGGWDKLEAISGALLGGYLDVLVTTEDVARGLLE